MFPGLRFEPQSRQFHVSRSGVQIPVKAIFSDVTLMTTHVNQSMKVIQKIFSIDWPLQKVERRKKSEKKILNEIWTPDLETWNLMWNWNCHSMVNCSTQTTPCRGKQGKRPMTPYCFTQCSHGCSLGNFLFPRQDHHVQRSLWIENSFHFPTFGVQRFKKNPPPPPQDKVRFLNEFLFPKNNQHIKSTDKKWTEKSEFGY